MSKGVPPSTSSKTSRVGVSVGNTFLITGQQACGVGAPVPMQGANGNRVCKMQTDRESEAGAHSPDSPQTVRGLGPWPVRADGRGRETDRGTRQRRLAAKVKSRCVVLVPTQMFCCSHPLPFGLHLYLIFRNEPTEGTAGTTPHKIHLPRTCPRDGFLTCKRDFCRYNAAPLMRSF